MPRTWTRIMPRGHWIHVATIALLTALVGMSVPAVSQSTFVDRTADLGFQPANGAACWVDLDNDGWVDLCASGAVWKNHGGLRFTKVADVGAVVAADFDNDGLVDLFSWSSLKLFRNQGKMRFELFDLPKFPHTVSRGACWGDFNNDGFLDLFIGGYEDWDKQLAWPYTVLLGKRGKAFWTAQSISKFRARGVTACDFDEDGDLDVYVSNYRLQPNLLWMNVGLAVFEDVAEERRARATSTGFRGGHSIGACWGDFDNDGRFDLFAGNFAHVDSRGDQPKSRFLKNLGSKQGFKFQDLGECGVHYQESYATPAAGDFDNDGNLDLFFTTVYGVASFGRKNHPTLFRSDGKFNVTDVTAVAKLNGLPATYQAAWADYDNDGDLDLVTAGKVFQNLTIETDGLDKSHWLAVRLQGDGKAVNRSAIGAQVRVRVGKNVHTRQVEAGTGEGNQNDLTLHFGLGAQHDPVTVEVLWPNQKRQVLTQVEVDQRLDLVFAP